MTTTHRAALALFLLALVIYNFPLAYDLLHKPFFTWAPGQDIASTTLLPVALLERGEFSLDEYRDFYYRNWRSPYFIAEVNGTLVSRSPVATAVLAVPFYGVPLGTGWLRRTGKAWLEFPWSAFFPGKFAAAFMTTLAVGMFFFCACRLTDARSSVALTLAFAFGTSVWSTGTTGLWTQAPSVLLQMIALWFLVRGRRLGANAVAPAAFFFSAATVARPTNAIAAALFTGYILIEYRAAFFKWIAWAIPPALFMLAYNAAYNGSPFVFGYQDGIAQYASLPQFEGILGLLISPSRGVLVYSPFLIFAFAGLWFARREKEKWLYGFSALVIAASVVMLAAFDWSGGWGYGARLLVDGLPYWMLLLIPAWTRMGNGARGAFWVMVAYAALFQSFGLWDYGNRWHWHWENYAFNVWDLSRSEPLFYLQQYIEMAQHYLRVYIFR